jgi:hypothetical protein
MTPSVIIRLPGGFNANGEHWREAHLRALTAEDQLFLAEECHGLMPAQWATEALTRCVTRLGPHESVNQDVVRALSVGDREALLIHLRRLTAGDRISCVLTCVAPACGEKLELDLNAADLLLEAYADPPQHHELRIARDDGDATVVRFRLPNGFDQEAAALLARTDVAAAIDLLLHRCTQSATVADGSEARELAGSVGASLSARMAELDPQAEIVLRVTCPACARTFSAVFDAAAYLAQEIQHAVRRLYHEIHLLAYHYHWSAAEILRMSARTRRQYLRLLENELTREAAQ